MDTKKFFGKLRDGMTVGLGICLTVGAVSAAYAAYSSLGVAGGDGLSSAKWNELVQYVVPPGAVMAFNLTSCPSGWNEYTPAYWRFIRGIDKSGTSIDPSGQRTPGSTQGDSLQNHTHYMVGESWWQDNVIAEQDSNTDSPFAWGPGSSRGDSYIYVWYWKVGNFTTETRSKNVALLYCVKN